jgi:ABC-type antimicrobial peptide transport system ATPase subunit
MTAQSAGCGLPIGAGERLTLADDAIVHFDDYECLIRYGGLQESLGKPSQPVLTDEQQAVADGIGRAISAGQNCAILGLAGTGKSTVAAYGYCLTTQAQGSEWDKVLLIDKSAAFRDDRTRWLYTAIFRAKERITITSKGTAA